MKKLAFTMADRLARTSRECRTKCKLVFCELSKTSRLYTLVPSRFAFTMAEILLSLTIIGVVAAITLPSLMGNINERTWNTQRKALHARMSQAIAMMPNLNGFGTYIADTKDAAGSVTSSGTDTAAEAFLTEGLSKVLKINNICDNEHLEDCGIVNNITIMGGGSKTWGDAPTLLSLGATLNATSEPDFMDTKAAAFETQNGESILLFYNPNCRYAKTPEYHVYELIPPLLCANFVYDLNGNKGPNTVGKDVGFISVFYPTDSNVVAPLPLSSNASSPRPQTEASSLCTSQDPESRLPNIDELSSMYINNSLIGIGESGQYWSGTRGATSATEKRAMIQAFGWGPFGRTLEVVGQPANVRCIKR